MFFFIKEGEKIVDHIFLGKYTNIELDIEGLGSIFVKISSYDTRKYPIGETVVAMINPDDLFPFKKEGEN